MTVRRRRPDEKKSDDTTPPKSADTVTEAQPLPQPEVSAQVREPVVEAPIVAPPVVAPEPEPEPEPVDIQADAPDEDFGALFEESEQNQDQPRGDLEPGDPVVGRVVAMTEDSVFIDLGGKSEGVISRREFEDADGALTISPGSEIKAFVMSLRNGIELSTVLGSGTHGGEQLRDAFASKIPVEGKVVAVNKGGLEIKIGNQKAFCPRSQVDIGFVAELEGYVGQVLRFRITQMEGTRNLVVSRRVLLEEASAELADETREKLVEGAVLEGRVRNIQEFGVFVDLGGIEGLVHSSEISWEAVADPSSLVQVGETVKVQVVRVDEAANRISLSMKRAQKDPWASMSAGSMEGTVRKGTVRRLESYGAFVEIEPGIEGLLHVSEMTSRRIKHAREVLSIGEQISVNVLEIDPKTERIRLGMTETGDTSWAAVDSNIREGALLEGTVERIERYGVFVKLSEGVTGLVPGHGTGKERGADFNKFYDIGQEVRVVVQSIDTAQRRISLSMTAVAEFDERENLKEYQQQSSTAEETDKPMGILGQLLSAKLDDLKKGDS